MPTVGYTTTEELARLLKVIADTYEPQLTEVLTAAQGEIDDELGLHETDATPLTSGWKTALAAQVQLERAVEHWHARQIGFNVLGLDTEAPVTLSRDTWERHANELAPLKASWGIA